MADGRITACDGLSVMDRAEIHRIVTWTKAVGGLLSRPIQIGGKA
jgi:hypothetical protein